MKLQNRKKVHDAGAAGKKASEPQPTNHPAPPAKNSFPIVGVGASAGGLEAFTDLLKHLPADTGSAFVLVQHLDPQHESALSQLLGRVTPMPVQEVTNNLRVKPNHVYAIPPNRSLIISKGILKLQPRSQNRTPARTIDAFFESLAHDKRERAIGVVLSGTASDGTVGLEAIKAEGGITFAQDASARYDSMPRSAVAADRISVNQFTPPGVLINASLQILQFRGPTGPYLQPPTTGKATFDILKMAREGLMLPLRAAINKARKENKTVRRTGVRVQQNGRARTVNLQVIPLKNLRERCFLILFEDNERVARTLAGAPPDQPLLPAAKKENAHRISALETELSETRDYLQAIQEQHEAAHEELQASNEEVQSANEELQSINEELETSKEELESANEELTTVNEEMAHRNAELNRLNADLTNFHASTKLPIVLLGRDLSIREFTSAAAKIFHLLATDIGRPLNAVRHNLLMPEASHPRPAGSNKPLPLEEFVRQVIDTVHEQEREAYDHDGRWYSLRARPYFTVDNKVDGAVLVLVDTTELKATQAQLKDARDYAEAAIRTVPVPIVILRADLRVNTANEAFYNTFETPPAETEGRLIFDLGNQQWNIPKLRTLLEEVLPRNKLFKNFEVTHEFPSIGLRTMLLNARRVDRDDGTPEMILLAIEDITERKQAAEALRISRDQVAAELAGTQRLQQTSTLAARGRC